VNRPAAGDGFTLIEMVVVIVLGGVLAGLAAYNIVEPIQGFTDTARRAALVDGADSALARMTREVRLALPNSVRLRGSEALEFLRTRSGGRYRAEIDPDSPSDVFDFTLASDGFDVLGELKEFGRICSAAAGNCGGAPPGGTAACMADGCIDCLVVFNTGQPGDCASMASGRTNAYCGDNVAGIDSVDVGGRSLSFVHDRPDGFPFPSPRQRFHVVDTPVSFICNPAQRSLTRYDGYPIQAVQPDAVSPPPVTGRVLATDVVACSFTYDPGTNTRAALVGIRLTLAAAEAADERVVLYQQVHVPNVP
jgi:MSHA biogenesis protein MshO